VISSLESHHAAGAAFDRMADHYDDLFTFSIVGRAQREVVWKRAAATFQPGSRVLEINCGTGEDAIFLANRGICVTACDASGQMIEHAKVRQELEAPEASINFRVLPTERLYELPKEPPFDGAFSNFSGLNCVADLRSVSDELAVRLRPGARLLLCLSTRFCLWEILHYAARGNFRKAMRRWRGVSQVRFDEHSFPVYYPTMWSMRRSFGTEFRLHSVTGVGITTPPSYLEGWIRNHPGMLATMKHFDEAVCNLPIFRNIGDHVLLSMERV
jgi:ubiquinone/menaquinone biosynthesis C-methylase UbiE